MFAITKLTIANDCLGRKVLKDNVYEFIKPINLSDNMLYGKNITISAIVGKNGSGKSTIVEIILRILNNFCAILCQSRFMKENPFRFILNLNASIDFIFGENQYGYLCCKHNLVLLKVRSNNGKIIRLAFGYGCTPKGFEHFNTITDDITKKLVDSLFYCIGINYAPFAFNSKDFDSETSLTVNENLEPYKIDIARRNWLDALFHKNDGYFSNVTIVPFRDRGVFDGNKELTLSRNRILELLINYPNFIEGYRLKDVRYFWNDRNFDCKFSCTSPKKGNNFLINYDEHELIQKFEECVFDSDRRVKRSIATRILEQAKLSKDFLCKSQYQKSVALLYLVYKVLNCAKYPSISSWYETNITDLAFEIGDDNIREQVIALSKSVFSDHSHITVKIEQTRNFLSICENPIFESNPADGISIKDYWALLEYDSMGKSILDIARHLPPPFLIPKITLQKISDDTIIDISSLSAGERQFYNTTSSIAYHIMNLLSISDSNVRFPYHRTLILLDEIELCFHPEYQRTFISSLVKLINRLGFNRWLEFHFLITTHSPFILSDIPRENILYLKDGHSVPSNEFINPFGANINDVLAQSFFLGQNGFMGEHAKQIILSALSYLTDDNNDSSWDCDWNKESIRKLIETIGEPMIKKELMILFSQKYRDTSLIQIEMDRLQNLMTSINCDGI